MNVKVCLTPIVAFLQVSVVIRCSMDARENLVEMEEHVLLPVTHLMVSSANVLR